MTSWTSLALPREKLGVIGACWSRLATGYVLWKKCRAIGKLSGVWVSICYQVETRAVVEDVALSVSYRVESNLWSIPGWAQTWG